MGYFGTIATAKVDIIKRTNPLRRGYAQGVRMYVSVCKEAGYCFT